MIGRAHLLEWREFAPWPLESQVEQDLVLSRALVEIFSDEILRNEVALRGGTALNKLFLKKNLRYSEDIDLVRIKNGPAKTFFSAMRTRLDPWLGAPKIKQKKASIVLTYRFLSDSEPAANLRLKIETNTSESEPVLDHIDIPIEIKSRWFNGTAKVRTFQLEELLGTKLRALYQRKKGRDLLDFHFAFKEFKSLETETILKVFNEYMSRMNCTVSRAEFEENLFEKMKSEKFLEDVTALLVPNTDYSPKVAYKEILTKLIEKLPGDPWKGYPEDAAEDE